MKLTKLQFKQFNFYIKLLFFFFIRKNIPEARNNLTNNEKLDLKLNELKKIFITK